MRRLLPLAIILALVCACVAPKGTAANPLFPPGVSPTPLPQAGYVGIGKYTKLAEVTLQAGSAGVPFVSVLRVRQPPGAVARDERSEGFVYSAKGPHLLVQGGGDRARTLEEETGAFAGPGAEHVNPGAAEHEWYLLSLRSVATRDATPTLPNAVAVYGSPDLPTLASGTSYVHTLGLIAMEPGGRTSSHSHGGSEVFYVLRGEVELRLNDGTRARVRAGEGGFVRPGLAMQLHAVGSEPVRIIAYFITREGEPWQTNLEQLP